MCAFVWLGHKPFHTFVDKENDLMSLRLQWECIRQCPCLMTWEIIIILDIREHTGAVRHLRQSF